MKFIDLITQSLENLLHASMDADASDITLAVGQMDGYAWISIADDADASICTATAAAIAESAGA